MFCQKADAFGASGRMAPTPTIAIARAAVFSMITLLRRSREAYGLHESLAPNLFPSTPPAFAVSLRVRIKRLLQNPCLQSVLPAPGESPRGQSLSESFPARRFQPRR